MLSDPIVALATPPGRSALALIRCSGQGVFDVASKVLHPFAAVPYRLTRRAILRSPSGERIDQVLYVCYAGPRSYTGEDLLEISTHGGLLVPAQALDAVLEAGARQAGPGEFTRRAVLNGKLDLLQAEATADLIDAGSPAARRVALHHLDGGFSRRLDEVRNDILRLQALIAYDIDFPDEDDGPVDPADIQRVWANLRARLEALLATAPEGERLREGALCVIAGRPNAGKSSLLNALVGADRVIVTEIPGTTRDAVEVQTTIDGFPFRLIDTAGLRETQDVVEQLGVQVSHRYLQAADLILLCAEAGRELTPPEETLAADPRAILLRTKGDLASGTGLVVSALRGDGLPSLRAELRRRAFGEVHASATDVEPVVTRARHRIALSRALDEIRQFGRARATGVDTAAAATHLTAATTAMDELIGVVTVDDVLDHVFRDFCVGK